MVVQETGRCASRGHGSSRAVGNGVWRLRRGLFALQYREFHRKSSAGAGSHRSVDEEEFVVGRFDVRGPAAKRAFSWMPRRYACGERPVGEIAKTHLGICMPQKK